VPAHELRQRGTRHIGDLEPGPVGACRHRQPTSPPS
jgi:hypothetical protein